MSGTAAGPPSRDDAADRVPGSPVRRGALGLTDRVRAALAHYADRLESTPVGVFWSRLLEVEFVDRSVALAAKAFVSLFPLLIVAAALAPAGLRESILATMGERFGLDGPALALVRQAFVTPAETRSATGVIGIVTTLAFAISFTTALQRVYLRAWRRPARGGFRNRGRGAVWVAGVAAMLGLLALVRNLVAGPVGTSLSWVVSVAMSVLVWWWTARLMLRGEVAWRPLLPGAVITGLGSWVYTLAASVWFPASISKNFAQFGAFGLGLAFVTWLTGVAFLVVGATVMSPALSSGHDRVGAWLRGGRDSALVPGAPPALPGPSRPMRLSDAFGRGSGGSGATG